MFRSLGEIGRFPVHFPPDFRLSRQEYQRPTGTDFYPGAAAPIGRRLCRPRPPRGTVSSGPILKHVRHLPQVD